MSGNQTYGEKALLSSVAEGDEKAFRDLFHQYLPVLRPYVMKLSGSASAAQDIVQNTFLRIWLSRDKLETLENPKAWIYRVAANECYTWLKKEATLTAREKTVAGDTICYGSGSSVLEAKETLSLIEQAVNMLPEKRKQIYLLSRTQGKKIPEIAAELGLSTNYVKNAIVLSLKSIREHLAKNGIMVSLLALLFIFESL